jgi:hypothetical protein
VTAQGALTRGRHACRQPMKTMLLTRKTSFVAVLVIALTGTPALTLAQSPSGQHAAGGVHFATLPRRTRLRKRSRYSRVRRLPRRSRDRLRAATAAIGSRRRKFRPRLPLRDSYARGPPR